MMSSSSKDDGRQSLGLKELRLLADSLSYLAYWLSIFSFSVFFSVFHYLLSDTTTV